MFQKLFCIFLLYAVACSYHRREDDEDDEEMNELLEDVIKQKIEYLEERRFMDDTFCAGKKDGNYKDPNRCDGFISCVNGNVYKQACPAHLRFDQNKNQCVYPKCSSRKNHIDAVKSFCTGKKDGNYKDPNRCDGFISCVYGNAYKQACPAHLRFDQNKNQCVYPKCSSRENEIGAVRSFCTGKKDGNYKDPNRCDGFISCVNGNVYKQACPAHLRFDQNKNQCVYPKCSSRENEMTNENEIKDVSKNEDQSFCANKVNGDYPIPGLCTSFATCSNGIAYHKSCPSDLVFSLDSKRCEYKNDTTCQQQSEGKRGDVCVAFGKVYTRGEAFIWDCTHRCRCEGPGYDCRPLCERQTRPCGQSMAGTTIRYQITNDPTCFCTKTVCF